MDRLAEILAEHGTPKTKSTPRLGAAEVDVTLEDGRSPTGQRRPRLARVGTLGNIADLQPFFARASIETYEGVYEAGGVDWEAVEDGIWDEIEQ